MASNIGKLFFRKISTSRALSDSLASPLKESGLDETHHGTGYATWKRIFFIVCCPAMVLGYVNTKLEEEPPRPEFVKYPHLRIRKRKFPWGDGQRSLFHNPHTNALPDGYEEHH